MSGLVLQAGSSIATYLVGPREPEYHRDDTTGNVRWYVEDGLGSVIDEVDPSGSVTANRKYDVFGSVRAQTGATTSKHEFVGALGHPSEAETGLVYMRARYMDPLTGRFESEDPLRSARNVYAYVRGNPAGITDRSGKDDTADDEIVAIGVNEDLEEMLDMPPDELLYATAHCADQFYARFAEIFGRPGSIQDLDDLLQLWNPAKAVQGMAGGWLCEVQMYNVLLTLVAEDDDQLGQYDGVGRLVTVFASD